MIFIIGCAPVIKSVYLWDGDKLYVEGESGLIVNMHEGYVEIQSGYAILKSGEKVIVGAPAKEKYIDQWNRWGIE